MGLFVIFRSLSNERKAALPALANKLTTMMIGNVVGIIARIDGYKREKKNGEIKY